VVLRLRMEVPGWGVGGGVQSTLARGWGSRQCHCSFFLIFGSRNAYFGAFFGPSDEREKRRKIFSNFF